MHCSNCSFDNPAGMKFCGQCGTALINPCPGCDFKNPPGFKFCGQCGTALQTGDTAAVVAPTPAVAPPTRPIPHAERRHLTVMFCDLVGSTPLSERLDPEDFRTVVQAYQEMAVSVINRFDGYVAQYLGDGILVYFGYPAAHENDAHRAILAGLGIVWQVPQLNRRLQTDVKAPVRLEVRVGVHTGLVVVGEIGAGEQRAQIALGETTNIAARLQGLAQPDSVVVSHATYRLVQGYFDWLPLGELVVKGISQPMQGYRALQESQARTRLEAALAAAPTGLTPLVGREQEVELLLSRWAQAKEDNGQVILLSGEAGIGKSRLVQTLKERLAHEPHLWLDCYASPYYQNTALYPFTEMLQRLSRLNSHDSAEEKVVKLERILHRWKFPLPDIVPLLAAMMSLPLPGRYAPLNLSPQAQKQQTLTAMLNILLRLTDVQPVLVVVEDLHWADPSTLEMLQTLVDQVSNMRLLALFTFRPGFTAPWQSRSYITQLTLTRLNREQVQLMARRITNGKSLPSDVLEQIVTKTDGVPIFVEELTKMVLEQALTETHREESRLRQSLPSLDIPSTLHDLLMARLDRLATVREVAQLGATLGREFSYELLQAISLLDEASLQADLARLVETELLYQQGLPPRADYIFKHALIQEAAYHSLLRSKRREYHRNISRVLAEQFPEVAATQPELLARHYTAAGMISEAVTAWLQAGRQALAGSANIEAVRHFQQALDLLEQLPESPERIQQQLQIQVALGAPLLMTRGYAAEEVEANYARAHTLCRQLDETPQLLPVLFGLWLFYLVRARYRTALELAQQIIRLAEAQQEVVVLLEAYQVQGITYFYLGDLTQAKHFLEQAVALYDARLHGPTSSTYSGADHGVACLSHLALTLWLLGYPDRARANCHEAVALAKKQAHPYSIAFAGFMAGWLHQYLKEPQQALFHTKEAMQVATEQGFALLGAVSTVINGWALAQQGQTSAGINRIDEGLRLFRATGSELGRPHFFALLAETHVKIGHIEEGLTVLEGALQAVQEREERFYEAELYRLKGELLVQTGVKPVENETALAEALFEKAIEVAREQQAGALELRATVSLCRLWQREGRTVAARQRISTLLDTLTEGEAGGSRPADDGKESWIQWTCGRLAPC